MPTAQKKAALESGESTQLWDRLVFSKTKARLGGRVKWILSGSAPLDPKLGEFLKITFASPILEGYGLTENFAGAFITHTNETQLGHVGSVLKCTEFKLQDIPEMDYSTSSNPPKGEILLRGPNLFREYYKDEKQTKEAFDPDGWFHTGDVGRINPNGTLSIIDRKKNIFKLEQGEYVAVEYLEGVFIQSKYVAQIWVYGSSFKRYLVAIVVPDPDVLFPYAKEKGLPEDLPALCKNDSIKKLIFDDLTATAKDAKLHGFEFVKAIHLSPESFSVDNDTMTPTFKLRRPQLLKRYKDQIDELYAYLDANPPASS
jgi:long-chain acyl-CoA synthetase